MVSGETGGSAGERAAELELHDRLLAGDAVAPSDLADRYLPQLVRWLRGTFRAVDVDLLEGWATESVFRLGREPARYNQSRGTLFGYLCMDASGDIRNALDKERRRQARQVPLDVVELSPIARNLSVGSAADPATLVAAAAVDGRLDPATLTRDFTLGERQVFELMVDGERRTEPYAEVLGLTHLPLAQQRREVKRVKDRLQKRLRRRLEAADG